HVLEPMITVDGSIERLGVIRGHPWLPTAALVAVMQWKYRPTILNAEPVEAITTATLTFTLKLARVVNGAFPRDRGAPKDPLSTSRFLRRSPPRSPDGSPARSTDLKKS